MDKVCQYQQGLYIACIMYRQMLFSIFHFSASATFAGSAESYVHIKGSDDTDISETLTVMTHLHPDQTMEHDGILFDFTQSNGDTGMKIELLVNGENTGKLKVTV